LIFQSFPGRFPAVCRATRMVYLEACVSVSAESHNISVLFYHIVCPAKYRRAASRLTRMKSLRISAWRYRPDRLTVLLNVTIRNHSIWFSNSEVGLNRWARRRKLGCNTFDNPFIILRKRSDSFSLTSYLGQAKFSKFGIYAIDIANVQYL
jgi:hypothetical protein